MYKTVHEAVVFVKEFRSMVKDVADVEIVVAPPFTALHAVAEAARELERRRRRPEPALGARRRVHRRGQRRRCCKEAGAEYVIIGHSERRRLFGETDETVNRKLIAALAAKLTPIVCIGETLEEREPAETLAVLDRQIKEGLDGLTGEQVGGAGDRLRAGVGDRHRPECDAGAGGRGARAHPRSGCASGSAATRPISATSSTAAA